MTTTTTTTTTTQHTNKELIQFFCNATPGSAGNIAIVLYPEKRRKGQTPHSLGIAFDIPDKTPQESGMRQQEQYTPVSLTVPLRWVLPWEIPDRPTREAHTRNVSSIAPAYLNTIVTHIVSEVCIAADRLVFTTQEDFEYIFKACNTEALESQAIAHNSFILDRESEPTGAEAYNPGLAARKVLDRHTACL